ncbi:class I SAM-dependent methyltransferase [Pseudomonas sp. CNPSo 3701]|uniref:class I SAM-dependent methyltransferase n=1 Tax=Pseudomonas sp. CNPSo 3701 TaxID=3027943 RepID=UPI0023633C9F|nr:class I SAM-dependent methyltransferase [Pseudomonas sp. CNPSo 3701]MDD1507781.1 class I SAM-dependent methyltransferase [Pseudomonas sp. CNPSo 3701]
MSTQGRIKGTNVPIDYEATQAFFEERGRRDYASALSATMYQDNDPELVRQRDQAEKAVLAPQLQLPAAARALDIGCGVGRWGWFLEQTVSGIGYLGIDFSETLIEKARQEALQRGDNALRFQTMSAIDIRPDELLVQAPFDLVIISGLLIYLNDDDCIRVLRSACQLCAPGGKIYLREPVGVQERLTLDRFYSEELKYEYSAIYRTVAELEALLGQAQVLPALRIQVSASLFPADLEKRTETRQHYFILKKS